jgi:hypothetical protein
MNRGELGQTVDGNTIERHFMRTFEIQGDTVRDNSYQTVAVIQGNRILDASYQMLAEVQGTRVVDGSYSTLAEVQGDQIVDSSYQQIGTVSEAQARFPGAEPMISAGLHVLAGKL